MLRVGPWGQRLVASLAAQAGRMPVLAEGGFPLSEVNWLLALWAVRHPGFVWTGFAEKLQVR